MASSPPPAQTETNWAPADDTNGEPNPPGGIPPPAALNGRAMSIDNGAENQEFARASSTAPAGSTSEPSFREKQAKPNKVYVGGLPEHTRQEDLQSCFGKIGNIVNIELKVGYGFVEFDTREAAEESVAKYHEGFFMGNKIRVEISHGGGRAKYSGDPGACFKCGETGHWARECPNVNANGARRAGYHPSDAPLIDRLHSSRDYPPPPPRDYPPYRDDPSRYPPPPRDRYGYDFPPPPVRRPSPPRDYRDYPAGPPPLRSPRDYEEYRMRGPPPSFPPPRQYDRPYYPPDDSPGYPPRTYGLPTPLPRDPYERYDRRLPPPGDRYGGYPPGSRPRTPPGGLPPRGREDFERSLSRDYSTGPPLPGRPASPPRYADYPRNGDLDPAAQRYRRRSQSPPRSSGGAPYDSSYPTGPSDSFSGNGFPAGPPSGGPISTPARSGAGRPDYPPRR